MDGKGFEALIKESCEKQGLSYTRLKDAGWQGEETQRRFTSKNVCDCIIFDGHVLLFAEAKHRKARVEFDGLTQLKALLKKESETYIGNIRCGFLFCIDNEFFYCDAITITTMQHEINKKSFNLTDAKKYCLPVPTFLPAKAKKYRLDIKALMLQF